jgi:hypothetical protein
VYLSNERHGKKSELYKLLQYSEKKGLENWHAHFEVFDILSSAKKISLHISISFNFL